MTWSVEVRSPRSSVLEQLLGLGTAVVGRFIPTNPKLFDSTISTPKLSMYQQADHRASIEKGTTQTLELIGGSFSYPDLRAEAASYQIDTTGTEVQAFAPFVFSNPESELENDVEYDVLMPRMPLGRETIVLPVVFVEPRFHWSHDVEEDR